MFSWFRKKNYCSKCGQKHQGLAAIGHPRPDYYDLLSEEEKEEIATLSSDFCIIKYEDQTDRFIRTVLQLRIMDSCETLDYGVWGSLSENSFNEYEEEYDNGIGGKSYFGRISNWVHGYEESTLNLEVNVITQGENKRPVLQFYESNNALALDWKNGILQKEAHQRIQDAFG